MITYFQNTTTSSSIFSTFHQPIPKNGSILLIPRSALFLGKVYHFTLTLYKDSRQPVSASQTVSVYFTYFTVCAFYFTLLWTIKSKSFTNLAFNHQIFFLTIFLFYNLLKSVFQVTVYETAVLPVAVKCTSYYSLFSFHVSPSRNVALAGHCSSCKDIVQVFKSNGYLYKTS